MGTARKPTVSLFRKMKNEGKKIVMLTAYDAPTAKLAQECGIDIILVGDSLGMAVLGYTSTLPVTLEQSLHHCAAVRRGAPDKSKGPAASGLRRVRDALFRSGSGRTEDPPSPSRAAPFSFSI